MSGELTDEESARRATHEELKLRSQATPSGASMHAVASYQAVAWPSVASDADQCNEGEISQTL